MDKSWMWKDRLSEEYENGVDEFLNFAVIHASHLESIRCPCRVCGNLNSQPINEIRKHLFRHGIDLSYHTWIWHGESVTASDDDEASPTSPTSARPDTHDFFNYDSDDTAYVDDAADVVEMVEAAYNDCSSDPSKFQKFLEDAKKPLYPGCTKFTKLSTLVKLFNFKARNGLSNKGFSELLVILGEFLPNGHEVPSSMYEARKIMARLGMDYQKIDACPYDCILYRKEFKDLTSCPTCKTSRWKPKKNSSEVKEGVPAKVLWYFPPIPTFVKMFRSLRTAKDLMWHAEQGESDGKLRHPSDSPQWKLVDHKWPDFGAEPRNLRLALAAYGINPHSTLSSRYSCWPVLMVIYNLPPWLCMKRKFMMLTMLISGPQQPGKDIDVFLAPLVDDLKLLWEVGVEAYDAYKREHFTLKAVLLWTINDFPAYGNLSGCKVKGYLACPVCGDRTTSVWLNHARKMSYVGHRKFLARHHPYRRQKKAFDGNQEFGSAPTPLTGHEILEKAEGIVTVWGKKLKSSVVDDPSNCMKKKVIFFDLEYWPHLYVHHNLDVMHIEKNVCDSIIGTLLNIKGKSKDGKNARLDMVAMGLREELTPNIGEKRTFLPPACFTLDRLEKRRMCRSLQELKVPDGYSSNFRSKVSMEELKLFGLKSHDCHVLMQQLLPVVIRNVLPKHVRYAITRFCFFFNEICSKEVDVSKLDKIQEELVVTLCLLEKYFLTSFFDIMIHLTVHLVREVRLCGPVYYRWMYPFEMYMKVLKGYVRNRNHPEGCIAESYIVEEAVEFCSEFLSGVDAIGLGCRNFDRKDIERPLSGGRRVTVDRTELDKAHLHVLENTDEVRQYIEDHMDFLKLNFPRQSRNPKWLQVEHNKTFIIWLRDKVADEISSGEHISDSLKWIAQGPCAEVMKHPGYIINGCCYLTKERDASRVCQNSGVNLVAETMQISSSKDKNPVVSEMRFYGVIIEIWELDFYKFSIPIFKCDWVDNNKGVKVDELGFTLVELGRIGYKSDPFILASKAKQVFYVEDQLDASRSVVLEPPQRYYPIDGDADLNDGFIEDYRFSRKLPQAESFDESNDSATLYFRQGGEGTWEDN